MSNFSPEETLGCFDGRKGFEGLDGSSHGGSITGVLRFVTTIWAFDPLVAVQ